MAYSNYGAKSLELSGKVLVYEIPVYKLPKVRHVVRAYITVINVVGMFPNINSHNRRDRLIS